MALRQSSEEGLNAIYWAFIAGHKFLGWILTMAVIVESPFHLVPLEGIFFSSPYPSIHGDYISNNIDPALTYSGT